jgi:hypothetical protein
MTSGVALSAGTFAFLWERLSASIFAAGKPLSQERDLLARGRGSDSDSLVRPNYNFGDSFRAAGTVWPPNHADAAPHAAIPLPQLYKNSTASPLVSVAEVVNAAELPSMGLDGPFDTTGTNGAALETEMA